MVLAIERNGKRKNGITSHSPPLADAPADPELQPDIDARIIRELGGTVRWEGDENGVIAITNAHGRVFHLSPEQVNRLTKLGFCRILGWDAMSMIGHGREYKFTAKSVRRAIVDVAERDRYRQNPELSRGTRCRCDEWWWRQ